MNVAPDQTIILGLQIFLDHSSMFNRSKNLDDIFSSYKFIFVQFHLSIFFSFTGRYWAVALDGLRLSFCISEHLNSPLEVDSDQSEPVLMI